MLENDKAKESMEACVDGAFALLSALFAATFGRAREAGRLKRAVLVFGVCAAIGVVIATIYLALRGKGYGVQWHEITCLPSGEGEVSILGLSGSAILLKVGSAGDHGIRIWEGKPWATFLGDPGCFRGHPVDARAPTDEDCQPTFSVPSPPEPVKERAATLSHEGQTVCMEVVVLRDGSVWYWRSVQYSGGAIFALAVLLGGFPGCLAGFGLVWLLLILQPRQGGI